MVGEKIRFRFEKAGDLRLLSHLDLMRCIERMLRRAHIPFKSSQGFHPTPRLVFALSLPLGVVGRNEVAELELTEPLSADDLRDRLNAQAPAGLTFTSVKVVPQASTVMPRRAVYRLPLPADRLADAAATAAALLSQDKVWADRMRPRPRRVNIRPYLRRLTVESGGLLLDVWVTPSGTARAEEILRLLGVKDIQDTGAVLERTELELDDEVAPDQPDSPPSGPPETAPLEHAVAVAADNEEPTTPAVRGGLSTGPVVE
jgi:radical SAM-linked protein